MIYKRNMENWPEKGEFENRGMTLEGGIDWHMWKVQN